MANWCRKLLVLIAILCAGGTAVNAQNFPQRPIRLLVPYPPGGSMDFLARLVGPGLANAWQQPVVIDNRPGAAGNIGTDLGAKAPPDGHTLVMTSMSAAIGAVFYSKLPYSFTGDLHGVSLFATQPNALAVANDIDARSVPELIALAKKKPGQLSFGSSGAGSSQHLMGELLKSLARIDLIHVPYKGTALALNELMGGQIALMFGPLVSVIPSMKAGRVRALAVTGARRAGVAPALPTMIEAGVPTFDVVSWYGTHVPFTTPSAIVNKLNREMNRIINSDDISNRLSRVGMDPSPMSPDQFQAMCRDEVARWEKVIMASGTRRQ